jgi:hypothetical protein
LKKGINKIMGCGASKSGLETVDDSVHVMLKHDKKVAKAKGLPVNTGYVPRAPHPLLDSSQNGGGGNNKAAPVIAAEEEDDDDDDAAENEQQQQKDATAASSSQQ